MTDLQFTISVFDAWQIPRVAPPAIVSRPCPDRDTNRGGLSKLRNPAGGQHPPIFGLETLVVPGEAPLPPDSMAGLPLVRAEQDSDEDRDGTEHCRILETKLGRPKAAQRKALEDPRVASVQRPLARSICASKSWMMTDSTGA
jgi:hypothetical protein